MSPSSGEFSLLGTSRGREFDPPLPILVKQLVDPLSIQFPLQVGVKHKFTRCIVTTHDWDSHLQLAGILTISLEILIKVQVGQLLSVSGLHRLWGSLSFNYSACQRSCLSAIIQPLNCCDYSMRFGAGFKAQITVSIIRSACFATLLALRGFAITMRVS